MGLDRRSPPFSVSFPCGREGIGGSGRAHETRGAECPKECQSAVQVGGLVSRVMCDDVSSVHSPTGTSSVCSPSSNLPIMSGMECADSESLRLP